MNLPAGRWAVDHVLRRDAAGTRTQREVRQLRLVTTVTFLLVLVAATASGWFLERQAISGRAASLELTELRQAIAKAGGAPASSSDQPSRDFSITLPTAPLASDLLAELQRASTEAAVALSTVQFQPSPTTSVEQLPHISLAVSLRGTYPKLKNVLSDLLDRYPSVTVHRLSLRRLGSPQDVEASVTLVAWARPAASAGSSSNRGP